MHYSHKLNPKTTLGRHVAKWLRSEARDRAGDLASVGRDLAHGCSSGVVGHLIYTRECVAFYARHAREIDAMAKDAMRDTGCSAENLFSGWDVDDPFARDDNNRNIMAWFGFEETGRNLLSEAGADD